MISFYSDPCRDDFNLGIEHFLIFLFQSLVLNSKIIQGKLPLLHRYPDALAGQQELENIAKSANDHHFALPPNKRVNFAKLGIASPFQPPWTVLVKDWRTDNSLQPSQLPEAVHVLRDEDVLRRLRDGDVNGLEVLLDHLVAVQLKIEGKGKLGANTIICIPSPQDLEGIFFTFYFRLKNSL